MKRTQTGVIIGAGLAAAIAVAGCGSSSGGSTPSGSGGSSGSSNCVSGSLSGAGSSFQDPMEQAWAAGFGQQCSGAHVTYQAVGSGAGITQFGAGTIDYGGSDVTMKPDEQSKANTRCGSPAIHIPVTAGGVGVTYNLSGVSTLQLSPETIAKIFEGTVKTWDDAAIKADNPGVSLPSTSITVFYRADASGTTGVFTKFLDTAATPTWTLGNGKTVKWPVGTGKPQNQGVSGAVSSTKGGVGYVEQAFATQHNLPLAKVKNAGGTFVELTSANVSKALEGATSSPNGPNDLSMTLNYKPTDPSAYPISTVSYVIVCTKYPSSSSGKVGLLKAYLNYAVGSGQSQATSLGFAPLPATVDTAAKGSIAAIS